MTELTPHEWQTLKIGVSHIGIICTGCGLFYLARATALHMCDRSLSPWERTVVLSQESAEEFLSKGMLDEHRAKRILEEEKDDEES